MINDSDSKFCQNCGLKFDKMFNLTSIYEGDLENRNSDDYTNNEVNDHLAINPFNFPYYRPGQPSETYNPYDKNSAHKSHNPSFHPLPSKISTNPKSIKIISLYEVILALILLGIGYNEYLQTAPTTYVNPYAYQIKIFAFIFIILALLGFSAGILLYTKKRIGYHLSRIYLVLTGIGFCWYYFITTLPMLLSFIYFNSDDSIKFLFKKPHSQVQESSV